MLITLAPIVLIIILGSSLGSFFNVCIYRIPNRKSIVFPSSFCPNCSTPIPIWLNIPILGYFLTLGKCRSCGSKIHWHYLLVEILTPLLFVLLFIRLDYTFSFLYFKYAVFFSFCILVFFIDLFHKIIPDVISLSLIPVALFFSLLSGTDIPLIESLLTGGAGFTLFYLIAYFHWKITGRMGLGGGDIKIIAGIGAILGAIGLIFTIFTASVLGLIIILSSGRDLKKEFCFGPFLVTASVLYVLLGGFLVRHYLALF